MIYTIPSTKEQFLQQAIEKLGVYPIDFSDNYQHIQKTSALSSPYQAAGVLLLLYFQPHTVMGENGSDGFYFRLIKRSQRVSQAGDLGCPGGILRETLDSFIKRLIKSGLIPILDNGAGALAKKRDIQTYDIITLFLANAVREAWEEIRLNPFHISFLGPLPSYSLHLYKRIIFPLVCFVNFSYRFRPNYEIERIVDIPVSAFFREDNYGKIIPEVDEGLRLPAEEFQAKPCLIYVDDDDRENVLWGATFSIVTRFLKIVFDFKTPEWQNKRTVIKTLNRDYLMGK